MTKLRKIKTSVINSAHIIFAIYNTSDCPIFYAITWKSQNAFAFYLQRFVIIIAHNHNETCERIVIFGQRMPYILVYLLRNFSRTYIHTYIHTSYYSSLNRYIIYIHIYIYIYIWPKDPFCPPPPPPHLYSYTFYLKAFIIKQ